MAGSASARDRRLAAGIVTAVLSRGTAAALPIALIPLTFDYLGPVAFGAWMAVLALTSMIAFADLGLGSGLMTRLSASHAEGDDARSRAAVASAYVLLLAVAAVLLLLLLLVDQHVRWSQLLGGSGADETTVRAVVLSCIACFVVNIPFSLVHRVLFGVQQVAQSNLWTSVGALSGLAAVGIARLASAPGWTLVLLASLTPVLTNMVCTGWYACRSLRRLIPRPGDLRRDASQEIVGLGARFLVIGALTAVSMNVDNLLVSSFLGFTASAEFGVSARVFAGLGALVTLVNLPLWPANGEALARGEVDWVRRRTRTMIVVSSVIVLGASVLLLSTARWVLPALARAPYPVDYGLLVGLAVWWWVLSVASPLFMAQNAAAVLRPQIIGFVVYLVLSLPAKALAAGLGGTAWIPWAGAVLYAAVVLPAAVIGYRIALGSASRRAPRAS